jgi:AGCS family alanine or glycine:cation symporter
VKQGLTQTLGVYFDTWLVCSITAFIVLAANPQLTADGPKGIDLTQEALVSSLGPWVNVVLILIMLLLGFTSIIGNYYYGESNVEFLSSGNRGVLMGYRALATVMVLVGAVAATGLLWDLGDAIMGLMALVNLIAIGLLSGKAFRLLKDYQAQRKAGRNPVFTRDRLPGVDGIACWESEESVLGGA